VREVVARIPEPQRELDLLALEEGLGAGLTADANYLEFVAFATQEGVQIKTSGSAGSSARVSAEGVSVTAPRGRIENFSIDLREVFDSIRWRSWQEQLRAWGISPELTYNALTGETGEHSGVLNHEIHRGPSVRRHDGWVHLVYIMQFEDGELRKLSTELEIGPAPEISSGEQGRPASGEPALDPSG
jgi:hypothetical protein